MKKPMKEEVIGGLESLPISVGLRNMRGRISNLSKVQVRAKIDIADGTQRSLSGVLRAAQTPYLGYR